MGAALDATTFGDERDGLRFPATAQSSVPAARRSRRARLGGEDGRILDVAYARRMSDIPQLVAAIDGRLTELAAEITALESAKAALDGARAVERSPARAANAMTSKRSTRMAAAKRTRRRRTRSTPTQRRRRANAA